MGEGAQVTSFVLNHMKLVDQRPTEFLRVGDRVLVKGRAISGVIMRFDADGRLAWLNLGHYEGWWHVKDLTKYTKKEEQKYFLFETELGKYAGNPIRMPAVVCDARG